MQGLPTSNTTNTGSTNNFSTAVANQASTATNTAPSQAYSLRARFNQLRADNFVPQQNQQVQNKQIDPALLARIALEEELKKRGGGGGGFRSFNPMVFVPYSFKLMAQAIEDLRQAFNKALAQPISQVPNTVNNLVTNTTKAIVQFFAPITNPITNLGQSFGRMMNTLINNPVRFAGQMANNIAQVGMTIFSAIANNLKKIFYGKNEEKDDADEAIYKTKDGMLTSLLQFFKLRDDDDGEANGKNIKAHIDNQARTYVRRKKFGWSQAFNRLFKQRY